MTVEIDFQIGHFCIFRGSVTLTLTSDDLGSYIAVNGNSTSSDITDRFVAAMLFIVNVSTYVPADGLTDIFTDIFRSFLQEADDMKSTRLSGRNHSSIVVLTEHCTAELANISLGPDLR